MTAGQPLASPRSFCSHYPQALTFSSFMTMTCSHFKPVLPVLLPITTLRPEAAPVSASPVGHCPDPVLENGDTSSWGPVRENDVVMFQCDDSYILKGSNWSQCLPAHIWAPPLPVCKSSECEAPVLTTP